MAGCIPKDIMVRASPKGYINKGIFYEYSLKWVQWLGHNDRLKKKNLLLLDAHKSHVYNIAFVRLMVRNNIEVMAIPSHTSHILQPLDSTPFATFRDSMEHQLDRILVHLSRVQNAKARFLESILASMEKVHDNCSTAIRFSQDWHVPNKPQHDQTSCTWALSCHR